MTEPYNALEEARRRHREKQERISRMPDRDLLFALYEERDEDGDRQVVVLDAARKVLARGRAARAHIVLNDALARLGNDEEPDR